MLLREGFGARGAGNVAGVISGFAWALTLTGLRWMEKHPGGTSAQAAVAWGNAIAFAACLPLALPVGPPRAADIAIVLYLGVFQIALAYLCLTAAIRHVPAVPAATLLLVEPVFNPLWTWLLQGENPGVYSLVGGAVIISAALWSAVQAASGQRR